MSATQNPNFIVYPNADTLFKTKDIKYRISKKEIAKNGYTFEHFKEFALEYGCAFFAMYKGAAIFKGEFKNYDTVQKSLKTSRILESRDTTSFLLRKEIIQEFNTRRQPEEVDLFAQATENREENITSNILDDAELVTQHVLHEHFEDSNSAVTTNEFVEKAEDNTAISVIVDPVPIVGQFLKVRKVVCTVEVLVPTSKESNCVFNTNKDLIAAKWSQTGGLKIDTIEDSDSEEEEYEEEKGTTTFQTEISSLREENASLRSKLDGAVGELSRQNSTLAEELAAMKRQNEELLAECKKKTTENLALKTKLDKQKEKLNSCRRFINEMTKD